MSRGHKNAHVDLTADFVRSVFDYSPKTGRLAWKIKFSRKVRIGDEAGRPDDQRRVKVGIQRREYLAHRVIWLWMTGAWPTKEIDHINENPLDNRWANLREATPSENHRNRGKQRNNTTGYKGVTFDKRRGVYIAGVKLNGRRHSAGCCFKTAKEAYRAVCALALTLH